MTDNQHSAGIVSAVLAAYVAHDRDAIEALLAPDYKFTSPRDNAIDCATYFAHCWPPNEAFLSCEVVRTLTAGAEVAITYEATTRDARFRNTEVHRLRGGQVVETELYFGWALPHPAPPGGFLDGTDKP
jgi:hypothetical protein